MSKNIKLIIILFHHSEKEIKKLRKIFSRNSLLSPILIDNSKKNRGYGGGINKAVKNEKKRFDYFLILNPDVEVKKNAIKEMLRVMESESQIGIVGPKILDENGKIWSLGGEIDKKRYTAGLIGLGRKNLKLQKTIYPDFISGTAMLIRKEVFEKIGLFADDYFLYYEDVDFCLRAKKAGFLLAVAAKAEIVHHASSTVGKNSPLMQYYMARNHLLFVERFAPFFVKVYEIIRLPKTLFEASKKPYELIGIRDYFLRRFNNSENWG